jgi:hypothetical protein
VLKGLFGPAPLTFAGTHYRVEALDGLPNPVQRPWPPLRIGGGGRRVPSGGRAPRRHGQRQPAPARRHGDPVDAGRRHRRADRPEDRLGPGGRRGRRPRRRRGRAADEFSLPDRDLLHPGQGGGVEPGRQIRTPTRCWRVPGRPGRQRRPVCGGAPGQPGAVRGPATSTSAATWRRPPPSCGVWAAAEPTYAGSCNSTSQRVPQHGPHYWYASYCNRGMSLPVASFTLIPADPAGAGRGRMGAQGGTVLVRGT